jgi:hypothetical protein
MKMTYVAVLLIAGCATPDSRVHLVTDEEKLCGTKATNFIVERYPGAKLDGSGVPSYSLMGETHYLQWATVFDRCMRGGLTS